MIYGIWKQNTNWLLKRNITIPRTETVKNSPEDLYKENTYGM